MEYSDSLKKNNEFQRVYRKGTSQANRYLVMYVLENHDRHMENRLGISVSKKVGNSVVRHRVTRLIRESYRLNERSFRQGLDIVVVARPNAKDKSYQEIESALMHLAGRMKIHMFSIWFRSNSKIWCVKGRASCSVENFALQSFFTWRIRSCAINCTETDGVQ